MTCKIITGDAFEQLKKLPDCSVDCCVTSPPYYGLRDYGTAQWTGGDGTCDHIDPKANFLRRSENINERCGTGISHKHKNCCQQYKTVCEKCGAVRMDNQIGLEETLEEYIDKLVKVFHEVKRVLKDDGTLWLNIGDSYAGSGKGAAAYPGNAAKYKQGTNRGMLGAKATTEIKIPQGMKRKDLMGVPWLLAFALRADGWYLRQDIIWYKPNCMPESVTDRCTKSHEYIFLFSKYPKYYFDYKTIMEPAVGFDKSSPRGSKGTMTPNSGRRKGNSKSFRGGGTYTNNQLFNNSTSAERETHGNAPNETGLRRKRSVWNIPTRGYTEAHYATFPESLVEPCVLAGCRPGGVVLDPFLGSGTTAVVTAKHGRGFIGIELNPNNVNMARKRVGI